MDARTQLEKERNRLTAQFLAERESNRLTMQLLALERKWLQALQEGGDASELSQQIDRLFEHRANRDWCRGAVEQLCRSNDEK